MRVKNLALTGKIGGSALQEIYDQYAGRAYRSYDVEVLELTGAATRPTDLAQEFPVSVKYFD